MAHSSPIFISKPNLYSILSRGIHFYLSFVVDELNLMQKCLIDNTKLRDNFLKIFSAKFCFGENFFVDDCFSSDTFK